MFVVGIHGGRTSGSSLPEVRPPHYSLFVTSLRSLPRVVARKSQSYGFVTSLTPSEVMVREDSLFGSNPRIMVDRPDFPKLEEEILAYWKQNDIFKKTLLKPAERGSFVFFEGPPTANGKPGIHHVEARAYKDVIPRFKTMQGYRVDRKAGWDTHGLPVEIGVEKKLGISGKPQIETLKGTPTESIAHFNALCKKSVWEFLEDWTRLTERIGFWLDLEKPYITYETPYIESVWWFLQKSHERKLLERDYKIVPYCPRCETPLSSHEVAQGYKDNVEDPSVFVRFVLTEESAKKLGAPKHTAFLVWTTTPWTLPGNGALAVHPDVEYALVHYGEGRLIVAKSLVERALGASALIDRTVYGRDLVGLRYQPLYARIDTKEFPAAYQVLDATFVSIEDGTGIVHIAPAYGEDDFTFKARGIPPTFNVNEKGIMVEGLPGAGFFIKKADKEIRADLEARKLLFRDETIRHTYPFCWRCDTPLLYFARASWYIRMSKLRTEIQARNETVNWIPAHLREGRFGEWLRELKDWAITRERYWGAPMPIWHCDACGRNEVIGSFAELMGHATKRNRYFLMRHGEALSNEKEVINSKLETSTNYPLTSAGEARVKKAAAWLADKGITKIVASPFHRMKQTAEMVSKKIGIPVEYHNELREFDLPDFDGKPDADFNTQFIDRAERFSKKIGGNETWEELAHRMLGFLAEYDRTHEGETVLVCSHGDPLWMLEWAFSGLNRDGVENIPYPNFDEPRGFSFTSHLVNDKNELDVHRPYIDTVAWPCDEPLLNLPLRAGGEKCHGTMRRYEEVVDVWLESGAMPFAQWHYPFENKNKLDDGDAYPADYIAEAVDQTRGWFYTLLAVATVLDREAPYKNVISLGHILDTKGQKMSKSKGNVIDPWSMIEKYGADAVRWFMYTVNQPGDPKNFDEADLDRIVKQQFMILWNVLAFWKLYAPKERIAYSLRLKATHVMDQWIIARQNQLTKEVTEKLEAYDVTNAGRAIGDFVNELSTWYVRRSRDRFRNGEEGAVETLGAVLQTLATLMAPFTPFFAEYLFREIHGIASSSQKTKTPRNDGHNSVHLAAWPTAGAVDAHLIAEMEIVRRAAEIGHALREEHKIKVRQPLAQAHIKTAGVILRDELLKTLADELNIKSISSASDISSATSWVVGGNDTVGVSLDLSMTPQLRHEGWLREVTRHLNNLRKENGLTIADRIVIFWDTEDAELSTLMETEETALHKGALATSLQKSRGGNGKEVSIEEKKMWLGIEKN